MPRRSNSTTRPSLEAGPNQEAVLPVLRKMRLLFNTIKGHFREVEKKAGVAGAQVWALSVVKVDPGIGVGDLARAMDIHQSTASNLLKPLLESGMLLAERSKDDGRAVRLKITAKGSAVLRKAPGPAVGVLPEVLSRVDIATLKRLDEDLEAVIALLDGDRRGAKTPLGQPDG